MSDEPSSPKPEYQIVAERLRASCDRLEKRFEQFEANLNARFDRTELKLGVVSDKMDSTFDSIERKLARLEYACAGCTVLFFVTLAIGFRWI